MDHGSCRLEKALVAAAMSKSEDSHLVEINKCHSLPSTHPSEKHCEQKQECSIQFKIFISIIKNVQYHRLSKLLNSCMHLQHFFFLFAKVYHRGHERIQFFQVQAKYFSLRIASYISHEPKK